MGTAARLMIALLATATAATVQPKNVLYIVYDDLRPDLSAYDVKFMDTPNIQKLADTGTLFERAYCQEAVCSPSRNSFATGRRPNTTAVWNFVRMRMRMRMRPLRRLRSRPLPACCRVLTNPLAFSPLTPPVAMWPLAMSPLAM